MSTAALVRQAGGELMENVLINGDLSKLSPEQRTTYYLKVCESVGLNPLTKPFDYINLSGKLVLYAKRDCADQLRTIHNVSVDELIESEREGVFIVTAKVHNGAGRTDMSKGAVAIANLKGEALANAYMKAETKAKRRATLSICGLGLLDETELPTESSNPVVVPREEAKKAQADVAQRRIAEETAKVTEMQKQAPPKSAEDELEERFVQSGKFDRLKMFEQLKKVGFPTAFGLDKGEPLYYDFLASADVKHCDEFKTLGQARKCFRQMLDHVAVEMRRQEAERRSKPADAPVADSAPFAATDEDLPAEIATASGSQAPAADDELSLTEVRNKISAHKAKLGVTRYGEILASFNFNSPYGIQDVFQGEDVLRAMKEALPVKV